MTAAGHIDALIAAGHIEVGRAALKELTERFVETRYLLDGIRVVLPGAPNSGKSTLANALAGAEHSIVSPTAGTPRDWVQLPAAIDGVPVTLVDTAGIAHTQDAIEQEAIRSDRGATCDRRHRPAGRGSIRITGECTTTDEISSLAADTGVEQM
jgi:tRNA U34 5-carboxymethylaminomethyl modifying GTPase MnmE/TrmE